MAETNGNRARDSRRNFLRNLSVAGSSLLLAGCSDSSSGQSGEKIKVLNQNQELVEVNASDISPASLQADKEYLKKKGRTGVPGRKFVMVVNLAKCKNARQCMKACQGAHQLRPEQHHINVLEMEDEKTKATYYMPKPCQHCDNPNCVTVCPVDATFKRSDGIVLIDNERCIGCRFCIAACPYSARTFNWIEPRDAEKYKDIPYDMELNVPQKKGTVTKCAFSADRVREGKLPYCVSACPNGVYYFGDENEDLVTNGTTRRTVRLSRLLQDNAAYTLMPELGTKPRVYYLPPRLS
ncbi:4Fe-4S dicluster domain-containing protein [Prolixibacteraceae bacterium Z1-6]|uniref:4Fe-4S dicluster domain-containing protein n=1 Tax=Draconibacterium aestuarii TaxID=2998507 RepID=A0A9X3J7Z2_9BACT|nr:4Fe-4S dicluster domain-containing protein [Prolixibacteraceae bacterium Z1-6]